VKKREKVDELYLKQLGKRIKTIRKEKNIRQVDLGYSCDLDKSNMNRIEAGNTNPNILLLKKISSELGVSLSELFDF
jgi:transcriptional regulator with XRE-family HTH domain